MILLYYELVTQMKNYKKTAILVISINCTWHIVRY